MVLTRRILMAIGAWAVPLHAMGALHVPSEFPTIQDAIDAAAHGDTVRVASGLYGGPGNREIDFLGKSVVLISEAGSAATVIDAGGMPGDNVRCFQFSSGEDSTTVVSGFTIRGGYLNNSFAYGAGVLISGSAPTIEDCTISACYAEGDGAGVGISGTLGQPGPRLVRCTITSNYAVGTGGGLQLRNGSSATLTDLHILDNLAGSGAGVHVDGSTAIRVESCEIRGNDASGSGGALFASTTGRVLVEETTISGNEASFGGGIYIINAELDLLRSTVTGNNATVQGGGIQWDSGFNDSLRIEQTILWDNCAPVHPQATFADPPVLLCCIVDLMDISDPVILDGSQVQTDPMFCDGLDCASAPSSDGVFSVESGSPALPDNNPCLLPIGSEPEVCAASDVGPTGVHQEYLRVAPNPSKGEVRITLVGERTPNRKASVDVYDVLGRTVDTIEFDSRSTVVQQRRLPPGVYFVRLRGAQSTTATQLVVVGR